MDADTFLELIQSRTARVAVGASTVRGRGNVGVVAAARKFLRGVDLASFSTNDENAFQRTLDRQTEALRRRLPPTAQHWGIARKVLNIFLRDSLYTSYLAEAYQLHHAEHLFELPLDSITARALKGTCDLGAVPPWPGVRYLTKPLNSRLQTLAAEAGKRNGVARVHLDALWWSVGRDKSA